MNNISIKNLTIFVGVLSTLILIVLFLLTNNNNFKQHEYQQIIQLIEEIDIDMLKLRRSEKDFLMRLKETYVDKHQAMRPKIDELITEVDFLVEDVNQTWEKESIERNFSAYYRSFDELVEQEYIIGLDEKSGLRGELRQAIHQTEKLSKARSNNELLVHILMLRRHEKDFLLRKNTKYLGRHDDQIQETRTYIKQNTRSTTQRELLDSLNLYQKKLKMLAEAYGILGLDSNSGIRGDMRSAVQKLEELVESEVERLAEVAKEEDKALASLTQLYFVLGSLLILAVLGFMVWRVAARSKDAMSIVNRLYSKVQSKDFSDMSKLSLGGTDEFAILTQRTSQLGEMIGEMYQEMAQASAESERIKQALDVAKAPVIVCDDKLEIIYENKSYSDLLSRRKDSFTGVSRALARGSVLGENLDQLNASLGHQQSKMGLKTQSEYRIEACGLVIDSNATAIVADTGDRLGIVIEWNDETDRLRREQEQKRISDENAGIRLALDCCDTNVMIADKNYKIGYMNQAVERMMRDAEKDLQAAIPGFDANNIMGQVIDVFHKRPEHQRGMLDALSEIYRGRIKVGRRSFDLIATPMFNDQNERLGTVVEWDDITDRLLAEENAKRVADENASIRLALDVCDTNVMMADNNFDISYMNQAVSQMMREAQVDLKAVLPNFDANALMGKNIDVFHKNPAHQRGMLAKLKDVYRTEIKVGRRTFALTATPIFNEQKDRLGTVVEWNDRTAEVAIEKEMDMLITAANDGDLTQRMDLTNKTGFFRGIGDGLNGLLDGLEAFIADMGNIFGAMAQGDLTQTIEHHYKGQFDQIKSDANLGLLKVKESLLNIQSAAQNVGSSANEVAQGTDDLSRRTESQASSLEETASSMEEITATVRQTSENASQSSQFAQEAKQRAENGGEVVQGAVSAMAEILQSSNRISDIIGVIDEIAFQTNLLALNAAVEAARAGEHGRGFAVVAGEVRTLSQRSAAAAKEIKDLIRDSVNKVESGSSLVNESGAVLASIVEAVEKVAGMIDAVNNAAKEQTNGISQINQAISNMDTMTQQNAALVEESSAASRSMSEEARNMNQMIGFFKL